MSLTLERLLEIARDGIEDELAPEDRAQFDRFIRRARLGRPGQPQAMQSPELTPRPIEREVEAPGPGRLRVRRWRWVAIGSSLAASLVVAVSVWTAIQARNAEKAAVERITALEKSIEEGRGSQAVPLSGIESSFRLTASQAKTPIDWAGTLADHYDARLSEDDNLRELESVSKGVQSVATEIRRQKPNATAKEILDKIFELWKPPEHFRRSR